MIAPMNAKVFALPDQTGHTHNLKDYVGKYVVLYFYPKDDTPGCTTEACNFRDQVGALEKMGAVVLGVSADNAKSHNKFIDKHQLNFPLLVDENAETAKAYGAWGEKTMFGKTFTGILRQTFLINPQGKVAKHWESVSVEGHVQEVLEALTKDMES